MAVPKQTACPETVMNELLARIVDAHLGYVDVVSIDISNVSFSAE
jgi:hypothetical protein